MESPELQQIFFNTLKNSLPPHISMVDEIADILDIGHDSVYRRVRGEKPISISELKLLCDHFHISLDQVLQLKNDSVVFEAPGINNNEIGIEEYFSGILAQLKYFNSFREKEMFYLCKDLPIWHFYLFPEIAAFKTFCWVKTIQNHPDYEHKLFSLAENHFESCFSISQQIIMEYNILPSVELWNFGSLNSSISQIEYYRDAGLFANPGDLAIILQSMEKMLDHLQEQAMKGIKYMPGAAEVSYKSPFKFYINEVILGNNSIILNLDGKFISFINYNVLSYLMTKDPRFTKRSFQSFNNLLSRATLISSTGEKYRNKFFGHLKDRVKQLKK